MTIREMVASAQKEMREVPDMPGERASELLILLSALTGNIRDELRTREADYKEVLLAAYRSEEKANRAKLVAETSPEYTAFREASDLLDSADTLIGSLKYAVRKAEVEMRHLR